MTRSLRTFSLLVSSLLGICNSAAADSVVVAFDSGKPFFDRTNTYGIDFGSFRSIAMRIDPVQSVQLTEIHTWLSAYVTVQFADPINVSLRTTSIQNGEVLPGDTILESWVVVLTADNFGPNGPVVLTSTLQPTLMVGEIYCLAVESEALPGLHSIWHISAEQTGTTYQCSPFIKGCPWSVTVFVEVPAVQILGKSIEPANPADINNDGHVDVNDLLIVINMWGPCDDCESGACPADVVVDCDVNVDDLLAVINAWG